MDYVLQLASSTGKQIKALLNATFDADLNGDRDFELKVPITEKDVDIGCWVFIPGTEIGGVIGKLSVNSGESTKTYYGYGWRGLLAKKIIEPTSGNNYFVFSGELNFLLQELILQRFRGAYYVPSISTGVTLTNYQFDRYCTVLDGITKALQSVGYRLKIFYNAGTPGGSGWVQCEAVPIVDYSNEIELSQDSKINFSYTDKRNGVNHLIVGGKGELQERNILHLYVNGENEIVDNKYYIGINEIVEFWENTSTETAELKANATEHLKEIMNKQTFEMDVESLDIDIAIGDIIGGRDYNTGVIIKKPLENIIVKIQDGTISKEYKLEDT